MAENIEKTPILSPLLQDELIEALQNGMTIRRWFDVEADGRATYGQYLRQRRADPDFAERVQNAREDYCEAAIEDAVDIQLSVDANNHRAASVASRAAQTVFKAAELLAPKRFSPKLQHLGADGGDLVIQVQHHGSVGVQGDTQTLPHARGEPVALDAVAVEVETTDSTTPDEGSEQAP